METEELFEKWSPIVRKFWLPIVLGLVGLILLGYGLIGLIASSSSDDIVIEKASTSSNNTNVSSGNIFADIEGAVVSPGVYSLPKDSRIKDLIIKAGGLSENADREWFAKNVNLALRLTDGSKLYIISKGEAGTTIQVSGQTFGSSTSLSGLININSATEKELDSLPGIGPATTSKIIQNRPYQAIEDLIDKKIVSSKVFEGIKDKISIF